MEKKGSQYTHFKTERERDDLFEVAESLAREVAISDTKNLIFLDRTARPLATALLAYYRHLPKSISRPNVYFINPLGFLTKETLMRSPEVLVYFAVKNSLHSHNASKGSHTANIADMSTLFGIRKNVRQVQNDFKKKQLNLYKARKEKTMVVDTCLHTGVTFSLVEQVLKKLGFSKLTLSIVSNHSCEEEENYKKVKSFLVNFDPKNPHDPAGAETLVNKDFESVVSHPVFDSYPQSKRRRIHGRTLRKEIRKIIEEKFENRGG